MFAVQNGRREVLRVLLSLNADTTQVDIQGKTALQMAEKTVEIKQLLLIEREKKSVK